jgi:hypothetical protein
MSFITWPHPAQTVNGRLSGKGAMDHLLDRDYLITKRANVFARSVRPRGKVSATGCALTSEQGSIGTAFPQEGTVPIATPSPR